jgi:hypothetical protein
MSSEKVSSQQSPWLKRVLVPFWIFQFLFMAVEIAVSALALTAAVKLNNDNTTFTTTKPDGTEETYTNAGTYTVAIAIYVVFMLICILCVLFNFVEIVKFARGTLRAPLYFAFNLTKALIWTILFGLSVSGARSWSVVSVVFNVILWLLFMGTLIYSSVIYHRYRKANKAGSSPSEQPYSQYQYQVATGA